MPINHVPTKQIPKDLKYTVKCKCGNTISASNEPLPQSLVDKISGTPCSECVSPDEYLAKLVKEGTI